MTREAGTQAVVRAAEPSGERSIGELIGDLANQTTTLVRQEIKLASTELSHKAAYAGRQAAYIMVGLLVGVVSLLALLFAVIFGLAMVMELWQSALLVGIVAAIVAAAVVAKGAIGLRDMKLVPQQTMESIREDKRWVEQRVR
jgi:hypothetical protein